MSLGAIGKDFDRRVFRCRDGSSIPDKVLSHLISLHHALLALLDYVQHPDGGNIPGATIRVLSGWRSDAYNRSVGGAPHSQHVLGNAADIVITRADGERVKAGKVQAWVDLLQRNGRMPRGGLGRYQSFTHVDIRGELARWAGPRKSADGEHI